MIKICCYVLQITKWQTLLPLHPLLARPIGILPPLQNGYWLGIQKFNLTCCWQYLQLIHLCKTSYIRNNVLPTMTSSTTICIWVICDRNNCTNTLCSGADTTMNWHSRVYEIGLDNLDGHFDWSLVLWFFFTLCTRYKIMHINKLSDAVLCVPDDFMDYLIEYCANSSWQTSAMKWLNLTPVVFEVGSCRRVHFEPMFG